ncbi:ATP-binding protein [Sphaerisporangium sp. NPDC088356]|uniref:ATP-binding protein n=1 Tax=Sphaerisporangium sp. NPDC088356 TaxID=3154871 RepID=UPI00344218B6
MPGTPDGLRTVCWDLPHDLSVIGKTRELVNGILTAWTFGELADDVVLVVSELLANAVNYGDPPIRLSLWASAGELCVRVTDHGNGQPRHLDLGIDATHGRGLTIVAAIAHDHGITPLADGPGKTVWARWRQATQNTSRVPTELPIPRFRTHEDPPSLTR